MVAFSVLNILFRLFFVLFFFFFQAEDGIRVAHYLLEFRRVLFRSLGSLRLAAPRRCSREGDEGHRSDRRLHLSSDRHRQAALRGRGRGISPRYNQGFAVSRRSALYALISDPLKPGYVNNTPALGVGFFLSIHPDYITTKHFY